MTLADIITIYLLALALIPLCIAAYSLSYVIDAKDRGRMVREAHQMMRFCVKMAAPYFAVTTVLFIWALFSLQ